MKKVHITLVGGQPVPVYIGIKHDCQAHTIVLVCSEQSKEEAQRIYEQFPKRERTIEFCSPVKLDEIEALASKLSEKFSEYEKTINLTSGTKLWSLGLFRAFHQQKNVKFIYVDQTNVITDIITKETFMLPIDTLKRFELYGTPITSFTPLDDYTSKDFEVMKKVRKLRNLNRSEFWKLTNDKDGDQLKGKEYKFQTDFGSFIEYTFDEDYIKVAIKNTKVTRIEKLQSEHAFEILFNSGWFELRTALELSQNPNIKNIWLNCKFASSRNKPKNEIDIIAELGNRLLFVECKTMIFETTDIDKFRSALRNFSGTSTTGLFVTHDKPSTRTRERYDHAMEKCKDNNILTFNFALWNELPTSMPSLKQLVNEQISQQNKR